MNYNILTGKMLKKKIIVYGTAKMKTKVHNKYNPFFPLLLFAGNLFFPENCYSERTLFMETATFLKHPKESNSLVKATSSFSNHSLKLKPRPSTFK